MNRSLPLLVSGLLFLACCDAAPRAASTGINLSAEDAAAIGRKIWKNECAGTVEGLTSWNQGEDFASLGIGHFIWYPAGKEGPFDESWPRLIAFMQARSVPMPQWVAATADCPWNTRAEFEAAFRGPQLKELRGFLSGTIPVQTAFIVERLQQALPKMVDSVPLTSRGRLERNFRAVAGSGSGIYALIDYVNFKGEGIKETEQYKGQGWGMAQVLLEMEGRPEGIEAAAEFGRAATRVLTRRVQNAPKDESRWLAGWSNRCATYGKPL
jgi:hypothetical protein